MSAWSDNIGLLLALASARGVGAANAHLQPLGLTSRSFSLLELLDRGDGLSQRELADAVELDPSRIVSLVDGLETQGLVERRTKPEDRRQRWVVLTTRGRKVFREARAAVDASLEDVLAGLVPAERDTLRELLQRIVRHDGVPVAAGAGRSGALA